LQVCGPLTQKAQVEHQGNVIIELINPYTRDRRRGEGPASLLHPVVIARPAAHPQNPQNRRGEGDPTIIIVGLADPLGR
jgi:hypothetical protein